MAIISGTDLERQLFNRIGLKMDERLRAEYVAQGHHLTGALEKSIHGTVISKGFETMLRGSIYNYGQILNYGVTAARIPFYPGSGNKHSKYITGLIMFWKLKGLSDKEAKSAAFATAYKQKGRGDVPGEGMPTAGSYSFSKTGERKKAIEIVGKVLDNGISKMISDGLDAIVDSKFNETESETV